MEAPTPSEQLYDAYAFLDVNRQFQALPPATRLIVSGFFRQTLLGP